MIKNSIRKNLLEYHHFTKKHSSLKNLMSAVQSMADAVRYIESACEEIDDQHLVDYLMNIKNGIMTDSGLGSGFDEDQDPDLISKLQKVVADLEDRLQQLHREKNLPRFF
jgi:hypothetical protein